MPAKSDMDWLGYRIRGDKQFVPFDCCDSRLEFAIFPGKLEMTKWFPIIGCEFSIRMIEMDFDMRPLHFMTFIEWSRINQIFRAICFG